VTVTVTGTGTGTVTVTVTGFCSSSSVFFCHYHYNNAPYSFFRLWPTRPSIAIYDVVMYDPKNVSVFLSLWRQIPSSHLKLGDVRPIQHSLQTNNDCHPVIQHRVMSYWHRG
jgi:hypothetical protein